MKDINALPLETQLILECINRSYKRLKYESGRKPTIDRFAFEMNMKMEDLEYYMGIAKDYFDFDTDEPFADLDELLINFIDEEFKVPLIIRNPAEDFIKRIYKNDSSKLTKQEFKILQLFWGVLDGHAKTYEQMSLILDIKAKKIKQILKMATRKVVTE